MACERFIFEPVCGLMARACNFEHSKRNFHQKRKMITE